MDGWRDRQKISLFYRTSSPIRAAALLPKGRSRPIERSRAWEPLTIWCLWAGLFFFFSPLFPLFLLEDLLSDTIYCPMPGGSQWHPWTPFPYASSDWCCIQPCLCLNMTITIQISKEPMVKLAETWNCFPQRTNGSKKGSNISNNNMLNILKLTWISKFWKTKVGDCRHYFPLPFFLHMTLRHVREIFCQGCMNPILRPNFLLCF